MQRLGQTRSTNQRDHLLQTPDTFVRGTAVLAASLARLSSETETP